MPLASEALAQYFRSEAGTLVASLTRQLGDFDLAEEAVQDAIVEALRHWPDSGVPREPGAWLRVTARRKATDRLRREGRLRDRIELMGRLDATQEDQASTVLDDRLVLIFMCCHPVLSREAQVALTLRSLLGLTTAQLAKAFLTSEATITKRIVRAKRKIVEAKIQFAIPQSDDVDDRLAEVLTSLYVTFNEGYLSAGPLASQRAELADDAEWLAGLLLQLLPDEPEVIGLLALIRLHQARRLARFDSAGNLVLLQDQDRSLWDQAAIEDSVRLLSRALHMGRPGVYQCQAAIAACHARSRRWEDTDWGLIISLYDQLLAISDSPVAALNRAIAIGECSGAQQGLEAIRAIRNPERLAKYPFYFAALGKFELQSGEYENAREHFLAALALARNPMERHFLEQRVIACNSTSAQRAS